MNDARIAEERALERLRLHLGKSAHRYLELPEANHVHVSLKQRKPRAFATLYFFRVSAGGRGLDLVVKVPRLDMPAAGRRRPQDDEPDCPRLGVVFDARVRGELERSALAAIQSSVQASADPRFGAIRLLDTVDDPWALVMERAEGVPLRDLLVKRSFGRNPTDGHDVGGELESTGAWLRHYHHFVRSECASPRRSSPDEFLASVGDLTSYLARVRSSESAFFAEVRERVEELAKGTLPSRLPLGLGHGDFAPRNVLVQESSRIAVFDTVGRWLTPVYEDVAYFLVSLRSLGPQIVTGGRAFEAALMDRYEERFLAGYFGADAVQLPPIRLFEVEAFLARWAASVHRARTARGLRRLAVRTELAARERLFRTWIGRHLRALV